MNPAVNAVRNGLSRGLMEFRGSFASPMELFGYFYMPILFVVLGVFMSRGRVEEADTTYGAVTYTGGVVFTLVMAAVLTVAQVLSAERENATLLRAKTLPHGMLGYTVAKVVHIVGLVLASLAIMVVPGLFLVEGFGPPTWGAALTLVWVCVLGALALAPFGAIAGSLISNPRFVGFLMIPIVFLLMGSGVMFPLDFLPGPLRTAALFVPVYWLGHGVRSGALPAEYAALEPAGAWQLPQVAVVLALWAVVGFVVAPWVLRRMARRESGSRVQAARDKAMKRAY
ncbi:ABC-2 type transport system permease protein [Nocardiopsis sp. Huas11]|uniref:ABC transporter permease n=1 Tax=Nocardiopsis sp. Huas11 TaxID=2183912 RepID=UPI000EB29E16|nr:ABC transporter permease [Nocardiopsis sp. Huas11]RKS06320.1 ABC-2 type transport system permease protein [Nocardiopsis sp. Huas11]